MISTTPPRILVIEDDPNFANSLQLLLGKRLAAEIVVVENGACAREALASSSFDLVTLDYQLPDTDGLVLLKQIRSEGCPPPVVLVTGHGDEATAVLAFQAGAAGYVVKDRRLASILPSVLGKALDNVRLEKALHDSEVRYRRLFEAAKDGILLLDAATGTITDVNPYLMDLLGYDPGEMLGKNLWEIGAFRDIAESKELFATLQEKEYVRYEHLPLESKDGHRVDVEFVSNVYAADHTRVIQGNIRDITDRKRHQDRVAEARSTLKGIIESTDNPIFSVDADYRYTSFNRAHSAVMMALYCAKIELGRSILEYQTVEEDRAGAKRNFDLALKGEQVVEEAYSGEEGQTRLYFEVIHNPIIERDGRINGVAVFAKDTTERKNAEEALRRSEQTLQTIVDSMRGMLFFKGRNNELLRANNALCEALNATEQEIIGRPLSELFPDQSEQYWKDDLEVIESGVPKLGILEPLQTPGGLRWVLTDKIPFRNPDGEVVGVIGFSVDVTERKLYEEELKRVNEELDAYAHTVSHDLKGPMASMGISLALLRDLIDGPQSEDSRSETREVVDLMTRSLGKADELIGALLRLAEAGQVPDDVISIDIGKIVGTVLEEKLDELETNGIVVDVDVDLGRLAGDYSHIYQLFANLIGNAIRHNDSESPTIEIKLLESYVPGVNRYLVRDNGSGIPPEDMERIFTPFFKNRPGGSGIGLSTVEKIVKLYGGEIRAHNDGGACFEFTLQDWRPDSSGL
jgi:PAS domain S-box-containing protein